MDHLTLTLAPLNPIVGNLSYNQNKVLRTWKQASETTDLVIFPELILCGYPPEDLILKPLFLKKVRETVETITQESKQFQAAALIGCPWVINEQTYNVVHLIEHGQIKATVCKHHLPNYGVFDEKRIFTPGPLPLPVEFRGHKLGLMICEDMWFPDVATHLKNHGANILIAPHASPFEDGKIERRILHARNRVKETDLPLTYVNQVGGQDELVFDGGAFVLPPQSQEIVYTLPFEENLLTVNFDESAEKESLTVSTHAASQSQNKNNRQDHPDSLIYEALRVGLRDYVEKNNFPGVLIGLSGGVDSALAAVLAVDAIGANRVRCIMMPSQYTSKESLEDAQQLAENLNITLETVPIDTQVNAFNNIFDNAHGLPPVTFENIQSRTRGVILMALSNASGFMVLSTGNKSEMAVGYATLYGDMCGGFNVLKDVYKTKVYALCRWKNEINPVIPERILTKAPTAELKPDQTDQDTLPPYEVLDDILCGLIEREENPDEIIVRGHDLDTVMHVGKMLDRSEYKRRQAPPGVKITSKAFGRDRRYPITNGFINRSA